MGIFTLVIFTFVRGLLWRRGGLMWGAKTKGVGEKYGKGAWRDTTKYFVDFQTTHPALLRKQSIAICSHEHICMHLVASMMVTMVVQITTLAMGGCFLLLDEMIKLFRNLNTFIFYLRL